LLKGANKPKFWNYLGSGKVEVFKRQIPPCDPDSSMPESRFSSLVIDRKTVEGMDFDNDDIPTEKRAFSPRENPHNLKR